ncbi:DUF2528 family protein [Pseudomonas asplenii]|uniref:DUF2528 family protein n=1 Tax=Pseudomonas asplenii TaxID=53407 RepID=UPI00235F4B19|nr:DUF2528 family protein [Pseudomonas asplenii]
MNEQTSVEPSNPAAPAVPNIKRFLVKDDWKDYQVTLEVNLDRLTVERAEMINGFWTDAEDRKDEESGDVIRTVIRLAGQEVIGEMLENRGAHFTPTCNRYPAQSATMKLHSGEGWGGESEGDDYGWCGIRVIGADVQPPNFEELSLTEISQ